MQTGSVLRHRYRLTRPLGRGGMADVYLAFDERRRTEVAVKVLREDLAEDPEFLQRFQREAEALARLDHPYVVRFYALEREGATAFIVMDYVAGSTLRARLAEAAGPLPLAEVTRVLRQVGSALQYAHNEGFIHRDIKPGNIMLREDGTALLSDFGIARAAEAATMTQGALGTPAYMSPEQILGRLPDPRTDVYSLGVVLFEMLTGRRPFLGETGTGTSTTERVRDEHLHRTPPDPRTLNPTLPPALAAIAVKALAKDPAERWQSIEELVATWSETTAPSGAPPTGSTRSTGSTKPTKSPKSAAAIAPPAAGRLAGVPTAAILGAAGLVAVALLALIVVGISALGARGKSAAALPTAMGRSPTAQALAQSEPTATSATAPAKAPPEPTQPAPTPPTPTPPTASIMSTASTLSTPSAASTLSAVPTAPSAPTPSATPTEAATIEAAALPTATETPTPPSPTPTVTPTPPCAYTVDPALAGMYDQSVLGCASAPSAVVWSAWQSFEHGTMFWHSDTDTVSILVDNGTCSEVYDPWDQSQPIPSRGDPPAGLYAPVRGFGYLWGTYDYIVTGLGWATDEEKGICAQVQQFDGGYLMRTSTVEFCEDSLFNWARDPSFAPVAVRALSTGTWLPY